jgi:hypothetical protein
MEPVVAHPARAARTLARRLFDAQRYAASRRGHVSFAVVDPSGKLHGLRPSEQYVSASVVKAMLLVGYLSRPDVRGRALGSAEQARLGAMIRVSDNAAATATYAKLGDRALREVARRAGMRRYDVHGHWANSEITAADQARFFARVERLVPKRHRRYAMRQLASITSGQRWGIPETVDGGDRVWFKGGWRGTGRGQLVHQAALVDHDGARWAVAILTDGSPSHAYGVQTVRGIAERLFR